MAWIAGMGAGLSADLPTQAATVGAPSGDDELFDAAAKLYEQGRAAEAAAAYGTLLKNGRVTPSVLFNQGNAWLQAGQVGRAIASYRQAQQLAPRDEDIGAALRQARAQVGGGPNGATQPPTARGWLGFLKPNEWAWLALGAVWIWFGTLLLRRLVPRLREATLGFLRLSAVAAIGLLAAAGLAGTADPRAEAVVVAAEAVVRFGPLEESQSAFTLPNGTEVRIADRKGDWCQVRDSAGRKGWVQERQVTTLR